MQVFRRVLREGGMLLVGDKRELLQHPGTVASYDRSMFAPIALFCFRRRAHLARTLTALAANHGAKEHDLVAFADGPRNAGDVADVTAVRSELAEWAGKGAFRTFTVMA